MATTSSFNAPPAKRMRYYYHIVLASESSSSDDDRAESVRSQQGYETELVMDTPDTDTKTEYDDSEVDFEIEFDIQSTSENEDGSIGIRIDTSTGAEDFQAIAGGVAAVMCANAASTSERSFRKCMKCGLQSQNPSLTYCNKCFQAKKAFYPPRPRGFKRKDRNSDDSIKHSDTNSLSNLPEDSPNEEDLHQELEGQLQPNIPISDSKELCIMCSAMPRNSVFVHGSTGHMCCCYQCALRTWKKHKKCPVCNRKANNVIKVFM